MPDVFVAPDEKKEVMTHHRTPLPTISVPQKSADPTQQQTKPKTQEIPIVSSSALTSASVQKTQISEPSATEQKPVSVSTSQGSPSHAGIPLFASFWQNPRGVYFDTQEANEHIILFLRQHFITNIPWIFFTAIFLALPVVTFYLFTLVGYKITILPPAFVSAAMAFYYIIVLTHAFTHFLNWYFNISLITQRRVLDIELKDLVYKKISATKMSLVQDINYQQSGTIRTIFNYGDVLIQTAGAIDNFFVNATPRPETVVKIVEGLMGKVKDEEDGDA